MMLRTFGSPCAKILGLLHIAASTIIAFRMGVHELHVAYVRWPELANDWMHATTWNCFAFSGLIGFNAASISPERCYFATSTGRRNLAIQYFSLAFSNTVWMQVGVLVGQSLGILRGLHSDINSIIPFALALLSCATFLFSLGLIAALLGLALSMFHPTIAALTTVFATYVLLAISANSEFWKAIFPIRDAVTENFALFSSHNETLTLLKMLAVTAVAVTVVAVVAVTRTSLSRQTVSMAATGAIGMIICTAFSAQAVAGPPRPTDRDICKTGSEGIEICVNRADSLGLSQAVSDVDAIQQLAISPPAHPKLADLNSYRLLQSQEDSAWVSFNNEGRRIDLTEFALSAAGIQNCTDLSSEGAFVIERVAVYFLTATNAFSEKLEKYGALYQSANEDGSGIHHNTFLTDISPNDALTIIHENWDAIYSCNASLSLLQPSQSREDPL